MTVYRINYTVHGGGQLVGTAEEILALLSTYPVEVMLEILGQEKYQGTEFYPILLKYSARRLVDGFEDGDTIGGGPLYT